MPITTFLQRFKGSSYSLGIMVESESADVYSETLDEVIGILRTLRKVLVVISYALPTKLLVKNSIVLLLPALLILLFS